METTRKIKQLIAGNWDAIFYSRQTGQITRIRVQAIAAVEEFRVIRDSDYLGLIPAGEDPHNPVFGLEFPSNQGRDAA